MVNRSTGTSMTDLIVMRAVSAIAELLFYIMMMRLSKAGK